MRKIAGPQMEWLGEIQSKLCLAGLSWKMVRKHYPLVCNVDNAGIILRCKWLTAREWIWG